MSEVTELVKVEPADVIQFKSPFTEITSSKIVITNTSTEEVIFKVKTTAPLMFCVKPNAGTIAAKASATITIMLQPTTAIPVLKKMFMVQALALTKDIDKTDPWKSANDERVVRIKLRAELLQQESTQQMVNDVIKMDPSSYIQFTGPFTNMKTSSLTLKNLSDVPVAFSCDSNYKQHVVMFPSEAVIQKNTTFSIKVMLNPLETIPYGAVIVHVSSLSLPDAVDMDNLWGGANDSKIVKRKLLVKFEEEENATAARLLLPKPQTLTADSSAVFRGSSESATISLTNPSLDLIAFKVMTTARTRYAVQPNKGRLSKDESITITVRRQVDLTPSDVSNDKLLVLSRAMHPDLEGKELWSARDKSSFAETKIDIKIA